MNLLQKKLDFISSMFLQVSNQKEVNNLLQDILTPQEIETIYERFQIIKFLKQWLSQKQIAEKLWVSITTVNRWSRVLKYDWTWILDKLNF